MNLVKKTKIDDTVEKPLTNEDKKILEFMTTQVEKDGDFLKCKACAYNNKNNTNNMKRHVEIHIEGLEFKCKFCQKPFKTRNSMSVHVSLKHRDENNRL